MSNYISIGFVYSDNDLDNYPKGVKELISIILNNCIDIEIKYSDDIYNYTKNMKIHNKNMEFEDIHNLLKNTEAPRLNFKYIYSNTVKNMLVSLEENERLKGILIEIKSTELLGGNYSTKKLNRITDNIINEMLNICRIINCSYAFCDNEVYVEYTLNKIKDKNVYSVLIIKDNEKDYLCVREDWGIDGM